MGQTEEFKGTLEIPTLGYRAVKDGGQIIAVTKQATIKISSSDEGCFELCERLRDMIGMAVMVTITPQQRDMFGDLRQTLDQAGATMRLMTTDEDEE